MAGGRRRVKGESGSASASHILVSKVQGKCNDPLMEMEYCRGFERFNGGEKMGVSARKLAAGLWHLAAEFASDDGGGGMKRLQCGSIHPLPSWIPIPKSASEGATKWDPGRYKMSSEIDHPNGLVKLYKDQHTATTSLAPALQVELVRARICIEELESERRRLGKKFKHFVRNLNEERTSWMRKECQKMHAVVDGLKDDLRRERRNCKQLDIINSKLLVGLADSKLSSRQYMHDYERERKSRESLEDVCSELVKEIEENRAEIEALRSERARLDEEVEEERKMLQLAEVWREERVQMKLIDAKLLLEEKYCLMSDLISEFQSFMRSNNEIVDMTDLVEVQVVKHVFDSLNIQEIKEFSSSSPISNGIYTPNEGSVIFEAKKLETNECVGYNNPCHSSAILIAGTESRNGAMNTSSECLNVFLDHDESWKDASGRKTVTQAEDHFSNYTDGETEHSANGIDRGRYLLCGKVNHEQTTGQSGPLDFETSEISPVLPKKSKKKGSSFRKLWRSSLSNDDLCKTISLDDSGKLSNGSIPNVDVILSENVPAERALDYQDFVSHCCSGGPRNPHTARAMKGCIEWTRGIPKHGLKSKLLEARIESQKLQLCNVLKHFN
ncbi:putative peroxidase 42-like [Capsicum annuum]|uniref:Uncharacterized protein n=1 Tax=Capsicum annuum TaxID=4072 RepID=A0A1U8FN18_CAPAN|nr:uncharacterized protein LOC107859583 [Capsicum annuum]XP_016560121.1 uncharacterized protein LOC107859583 [Capsicum annuum]XP_047263012.1 uncharacterized protein LOC107859583 [Capsicum annuum]KAF3625151.1 putative peroxidase 42-like [Capsicum annuum]KAF3649812.1 putative peroxidase 42-like [Capsicum annuum]PHT90718.1 hypothetical protein T459_05831 [Capsicum annuum]